MAHTAEIKITQRQRPSTEKQKIILLGLGLRKMNRPKVLKDTPAVRGMISKVSHLVTVEEVN